MENFVFFHIGADTEQPQMLTHSILESNKNTNIIQCSDISSPEITGVSKVFRLNGNQDQLMLFRLEAFSQLRLEQPAIYLDTDMLVKEQVRPSKLLQANEVMLCRRSFMRDAVFNPNQRGISFAEYANQKIDAIYPFLACATITRDWKFWCELLDFLKLKDKKFLKWYGDQEAMREWQISNKNKKVGYLSESVFGCLPEFSELAKKAKILHFKGPNRKVHMSRFFNALYSPLARDTQP